MTEALGGTGGDWDLRLPGFGGGTHSGDPRKALEQQLEFCRQLHSAGGLIVGGTDAGGVSMPPPGFSLLREIEMLAIPMGDAAALRAVTSQAARYLRKDGDIGSIARGRFADVLVIDGDPLNDVRDLRKLTSSLTKAASNTTRGDDWRVPGQSELSSRLTSPRFCGEVRPLC